MNTNHVPLVTNKLLVYVEYTSFFEKYGIVSYEGKDSNKNLAYEKLSNLPVLSVTGLRVRNGQGFPISRFFVLTLKRNVDTILNSLGKYDNIKKRYEELDDYDEPTKQRIITSLAINSIGMEMTPGFMYNNASLIVCDPFNFFVRKSKKEMVCLGIEINPYLNFCAKTLTFKHPYSMDNLKKNLDCVFMTGSLIKGNDWMGEKISRITLSYKEADGYAKKLDELFIKEASIFHNNLVPYLPSSKKEFNHGKLFVLWEIFNLVNAKFKGLLNLKFKEYDVYGYSDKDTAPLMRKLFKSFFHNKRFEYIDPFKTDGTTKIIKDIQSLAEKNIESRPSLFSEDEKEVMYIKLCKNDEEADFGYSKGDARILDSAKAIQHVAIATDINDAMVRKILMELIIKSGNASARMPDIFCESLKGWTFYRYYQRKDKVYGTKMKLNCNEIVYEDYGFNKNKSVDFYNFTLLELNLLHPDVIKGSKDYMALKKDGNVYIIIDTDEIPVFNAKLIEEVYEKLGTTKERVKNTQFKNIDNRDIYINGYIGLKTFRTKGLYGVMDGSVAYLAGLHNINSSQTYDKVPRVKNIFCLSIKDKSRIEKDMLNIIQMLKFGFGRWGCNMAFPLPFKYMVEHLDNLCMLEHSCHWSQLRSTLRKNEE